MGIQYGFVGELLVDDVVGLDYDGLTGELSLTSGYVIPTTAQMANHAHQDVTVTASPTWLGLTIEDGSSNIIFYVDDDEMYFTAAAAAGGTGEAIGLLLTLTYA